ncbi:MAG: N-(2-amino-2-carboxyethyl)-L-glutamate synthase [Acidobacteriota bacterium]|jgi:cysteine synthase A|nr:N-(2-amino-2-carboxyethyl)-L-glutamate synthase [Acidobacteriota bacterium]
MQEGILSAVGNTPLIRLHRFFQDPPFRLYAKLESLNPGGSMKDRPALNMIRRAMESGEVGPETVIIESSSGNMGVGLAQVCSYLGLHFICVVDSKTTLQNIRLLEAYGAEVDVISEPDPLTGDLLPARIARVKTLLATIENSFWPNQYANVYNAQAHHQTMEEIVNELGTGIDYVFCATSTCGTMRGCAEYVREHGLKTRIIAVDAVGSVIFGGQKAKRLIPGHGAAVRSPLFQHGMADTCVHVTDLDCVIGCRRLARQEAILTGGSSGAIMMAIDRMKESIPRGATCVAILPDRGERYLDTIYSDAWVLEHFVEIEPSELWGKNETEQLCEMATY